MQSANDIAIELVSHKPNEIITKSQDTKNKSMYNFCKFNIYVFAKILELNVKVRIYLV